MLHVDAPKSFYSRPRLWRFPSFIFEAYVAYVTAPQSKQVKKEVTRPLLNSFLSRLCPPLRMYALAEAGFGFADLKNVGRDPWSTKIGSKLPVLARYNIIFPCQKLATYLTSEFFRFFHAFSGQNGIDFMSIRVTLSAAEWFFILVRIYMCLQFSRDRKFESHWVQLKGFSFWWWFLCIFSSAEFTNFESHWVQLNGFFIVVMIFM